MGLARTLGYQALPQHCCSDRTRHEQQHPSPVPSRRLSAQCRQRLPHCSAPPRSSRRASVRAREPRRKGRLGSLKPCGAGWSTTSELGESCSVTASFSSGMWISSAADAMFCCASASFNTGFAELPCHLGGLTWKASPPSTGDENAPPPACRATDFKSVSPQIEFGRRSALRRPVLYSTVKLRLVFHVMCLGAC